MLAKVLAALPSDQNWDKTNPAEAVMLAEGEFRYNLMHRDWDKLQATEGESEETLQTKEGKLAKGLDNMLTPVAGSSTDIPIKIEHPEWLALQAKVSDINSVEGKLQGHANELRRLCSQCGAMGTQDSLKRKNECNNSATALEPLLTKLTDVAMKHKYMKDKGNLEAIGKMEAEMDKILKESADFAAAAKERCKRIRTWIEIQ